MPGLLPDIDPDGLLEYSVVFTDRSLNHMSPSFQGVMNDISATLKRVYGAAANLAEFGCPPKLGHALLTESALDSGLSPAETRRQIECGLRSLDGGGDNE